MYHHTNIVREQRAICICGELSLIHILAIMTMLLSEYANEKIDVLKTVGMLLIHDIVEIDAGEDVYKRQVLRTRCCLISMVYRNVTNA